MPSLHHLLKSVHSQPGIKSKLKSLLGKSSSSSLYRKPGTRDPFIPSWLPSSSVRSFQCEISKFSSRTWEVNESEKPFSVSDAVSRIFATPSIHGPMWQALSYHTHQFLDENSVLNRRDFVHLAAAALQCKITRATYSNFEAKFMWLLEAPSESCVFGVSVSKLWTDSKSPVWEDFTKIATCKQVDFHNIPQIDWSWDFEETRENKDIEESQTQTFTFQSTLTNLYSFCSELCHSALSTLLGSLMHDFGELKSGSFLLDISPEFPVIDDICVASQVQSCQANMVAI